MRFCKHRELNKELLVIALLLFSGNAISHGGGLDSNGGHTNRKTGEYHCHREPCQSTHRQAQEAIDEAQAEGREFVSVYDRSDWPHWTDADGDCQDTRAEVLITTSRVPVKFKRNRGCVVTWGQWLDPYTGQMFDKASDLDIDHIVPLKEAHVSGGYAWTREQRRAFANDPENLVPVSADANRQKGASDPSSWLPDPPEVQCQYLRQWVLIKEKYQLDADEKERAAVTAGLRAC